MARRRRRRWSEAGPGPGGSSQMFRGKKSEWKVRDIYFSNLYIFIYLFEREHEPKM